MLKPIKDQVRVLQDLFPNLEPSFQQLNPDLPLPGYATGWLAVPRWTIVADEYPRSVHLLLKKFEELKMPLRQQWDTLIPSTLRESGEKVLAMQRLMGREWTGELYIIPIRLWRQGNWSPRRVRAGVMRGEFCLGAFEVAVMLLTHPELQRRGNGTGYFCLGDEMKSGRGAIWRSLPAFHHYAGSVVKDEAARDELIFWSTDEGGAHHTTMDAVVGLEAMPPR